MGSGRIESASFLGDHNTSPPSNHDSLPLGDCNSSPPLSDHNSSPPLGDCDSPPPLGNCNSPPSSNHYSPPPVDPNFPLLEDCDTPLPTVPVIKKNIVRSNATPARSMTVVGGVGVVAAPVVGDGLLRADVGDAHVVAIPQFITVVPKKNKASIHSYLTSCQDTHFQQLLQAYIAFEDAAATSGRVGSLPTTKRPSHISWWIRCARVDAPPSWSSLHDYGSSVISWWSYLQPSWRKLECGTPSREEGSFDCLFQPGINGFLNVVILAYWWSNGLIESGANSVTESSKYHWFVTDVTWVLSKLFEAAQSN